MPRLSNYPAPMTQTAPAARAVAPKPVAVVVSIPEAPALAPAAVLVAVAVAVAEAAVELPMALGKFTARVVQASLVPFQLPPGFASLRAVGAELLDRLPVGFAVLLKALAAFLEDRKSTRLNSSH